MTQAKSCPKCEGEMVEGFVADQGYGEATVPKWRAGTPRKSIWVGLKLGGTEPIEIATSYVFLASADARYYSAEVLAPTGKTPSR